MSATIQSGLRLPWRPEMAVNVDGLTLTTAGKGELLPWSHFERSGPSRPAGDGWTLHRRYLGGRIEDALIVRRDGRSQNVSRWFSSVGPDVTMAIVEYLAATPSARAALTNLDDLVPALRALQANEPRPRVPLEPVVHSADRHRAILAALDHVWPRRFAGYPAADEARPSVEQVVDAVLARAPAWVAAESRDKLTEQIRRHLAIGSWDFTFLSIVGNS